MDNDQEISRDYDFPQRRSAKIEQRGFRPYIVAWESELRFMAGLGGSVGDIETGGEIYGLETHAGRPVIMNGHPSGTKCSPPSGTVQTRHRLLQESQ